MSDTEPQSRIGSSERVRPVPDSPVDAVLSLQAPIGDYEAGIRGVRGRSVAIWSALVGHSSAPATVAVVRSANTSNADQIASMALKGQAAWRNPDAEAKVNRRQTPRRTGASGPPACTRPASSSPQYNKECERIHVIHRLTPQFLCGDLLVAFQ